MLILCVFASFIAVCFSERGQLEVDFSWPSVNPNTRYVSAVALNDQSEIFVFERIDRNWVDPGTFDENNNYLHKYLGPIQEDTIKQIDRDTGAPLESFGGGIFYMPHSLTIDHEHNYWVTDTALHQVMKFNKDKELVLVLGKKFEPATTNYDEERFCKPNSVAVVSNGDFFVSDGYCNQRVIKYNAQGERIGQINHHFFLPHSLALLETLDTACLADIKNKNIVCFSAGINNADSLGKLRNVYSDPRLEYIYAIAADKTNGLLYGVTVGTKVNYKPRGFTIDLNSGCTPIIAEWNADPKFQVPHGLAVERDGSAVYVGEVLIDQVNLWRFVPVVNA